MKTSIVYHLNKVWFLKNLAETLDFKTAAYNLGVTPSALTQAIKNLERQLEQTLIIRERGSIRLTSEGMALLEKTAPLLSNIELIDQELFEQEGPSIIRIGAYDTLGIRYIPKLYPKLLELNKDMKIELHVGRSHELQTQVHQGHLDMALVIEAPRTDSFELCEIGENTLSFFTHNDNLSDKKFKSHLSYGCLRPEVDGRQSFFTKGLEHAKMKSRTFQFQTDSLESLLSLTLSGKLISLLPTHLAKGHKDLINVNDLVNAPDIEKHTKHKIHLISRKTFPSKWRISIEECLKNTPI
ncbi:LysR family transcriptional regulator [Bacteriovoracaceae bacterium]|nr:LysR family transcriptional regulator [Bacteriovoracaceae bacterium]